MKQQPRFAMKYCQIDRIVSLEPGQQIIAERTLRADEEYLQDHFPRFPVMPGVMMLEALHQAAIWLVRVSEDFSSPLVLLREARNVKFGAFLSPGETLQITASILKQEGPLTTVKATATKGDRVTVSTRLLLECCQTGDPESLGSDEEIRTRVRKQFTELFGEQFLPATYT